MIPFFQYNAFQIGPLTIQVWGLLVSFGIGAAIGTMYTLARRYFLSTEALLDMSVWALVAGLVGGRLFHVIFYDPTYYLAHPERIIRFWEGGASSFGGFFGAAVAMWVFAKVRRFSWKDLLPYLDIISVGLWLGWGIGRLGCFLIHDHPGRLTNFFLAVQYPGGARHDLGLYESLVGFFLFIVSYFLFPRLKKIGAGATAAFSWWLYAFIRFWLDFLRATDVANSDSRYAGLTPAQWGMLVLFAALTFIGVWSTVRRKRLVQS